MSTIASGRLFGRPAFGRPADGRPADGRAADGRASFGRAAGRRAAGGNAVIAVPARGDADALAVTLHGLGVDHADALADAQLVVLDDRPTGRQSGVIAELADRSGAMLLRYDEVDGWPAVEAVFEAGLGAPVVVIEAGVLMPPGAIATAIAEGTRGGDDILISDGPAGLDAWVAQTLPPMPPMRGFGAVDETLPDCWRHTGRAVRRTRWWRARRVIDRPAAAPTDALRNRLLGAMYTGAPVPEALREARRGMSTAMADRVLFDVQALWRSPLGRQDAVYWFSDPATGTGWGAARAELDRDGVGRATRGVRFLDGPATGAGRRALTWATMSARALARGWRRVVVIEGCIAVHPSGMDRMRRDLDLGRYDGGLDVVHLDRTSSREGGPLLAVLLSHRALAELAARLPATSGEYPDVHPVDADPDAVLLAAGGGGRLRIAGQADPVFDRPAPTGAWLRP